MRAYELMVILDGDLDDDATYAAMSAQMGPGGRALFYLEVPPVLFGRIARGIFKKGLNASSTVFARRARAACSAPQTKGVVPLAAEHPGRVLSRAALMNLVRGEALEAFDRSIDVHVSRIRAAIEDDPKRPRRLLTVRGSGYVFAKKQDED